MKKITLLCILLAVSFGYSQTEVAVNGDFETGDFTKFPWEHDECRYKTGDQR